MPKSAVMHYLGKISIEHNSIVKISIQNCFLPIGRLTYARRRLDTSQPSLEFSSLSESKFFQPDDVFHFSLRYDVGIKTIEQLPAAQGTRQVSYLGTRHSEMSFGSAKTCGGNHSATMLVY